MNVSLQNNFAIQNNYYGSYGPSAQPAGQSYAPFQSYDANSINPVLFTLNQMSQLLAQLQGGWGGAAGGDSSCACHHDHHANHDNFMNQWGIGSAEPVSQPKKAKKTKKASSNVGNFDFIGNPNAEPTVRAINRRLEARALPLGDPSNAGPGPQGQGD